MEQSEITGAASGDWVRARKSLPTSKAVATYVEEGISLRTTQGVGVCFWLKNHVNLVAHSTSKASLKCQQPVDLS